MMTELFDELSLTEACALLERFHIGENFAPSQKPDTDELLPPSYFCAPGAPKKARRSVREGELLTPAFFQLLSPEDIRERGKRARETDCVYPEHLFNAPLPKRRLDVEFELTEFQATEFEAAWGESVDI